MLSRENRLTETRMFGPVVRRGRRAGSRTLVLHLGLPGAAVAGPSATSPPRVGLVVSKAVGGAVTRSTVKRRLRHLARERLASLPDGAVLVLRALPPSATASSEELAADLDRCLTRALPTARPSKGES